MRKTDNLPGKGQHISKVTESEILWYIHRNRSLFLLIAWLEASFIKILDHNFSFDQTAMCMTYSSEQETGPWS